MIIYKTWAFDKAGKKEESCFCGPIFPSDWLWMAYGVSTSGGQISSILLVAGSDNVFKDSNKKMCFPRTNARVVTVQYLALPQSLEKWRKSVNEVYFDSMKTTTTLCYKFVYSLSHLFLLAKCFNYLQGWEKNLFISHCLGDFKCCAISSPYLSLNEYMLWKIFKQLLMSF